MKEDYVSFKTAMLLKEKDFNEPCRAFYHTDKTLRFQSEGWYNEQAIAPTQALAIKWLRIKHNLNIEVGYSVEDKKWRANIYNLEYVIPIQYGVIYKVGKLFNTPEAAIEDTLIFALEKLVK